MKRLKRYYWKGDKIIEASILVSDGTFERMPKSQFEPVEKGFGNAWFEECPIEEFEEIGIEKRYNMKDIYFDSIEYGAKNIDNGVSYNGLKKYLNNKGYVIRDNFETNYFMQWFFRSFYISGVFEHENKVYKTGEGGNINLKLEDNVGKKGFLVPELYTQYLSTKNAKTSKNIAIGAFSISILAFLASLLFNILPNTLSKKQLDIQTQQLYLLEEYVESEKSILDSIFYEINKQELILKPVEEKIEQ